MKVKNVELMQQHDVEYPLHFLFIEEVSRYVEKYSSPRKSRLVLYLDNWRGQSPRSFSRIRMEYLFQRLDGVDTAAMSSRLHRYPFRGNIHNVFFGVQTACIYKSDIRFGQTVRRQYLTLRNLIERPFEELFDALKLFIERYLRIALEHYHTLFFKNVHRIRYNVYHI